MDKATVIFYIIQTLVGLAIGIIGYFIKDLKSTIVKELEALRNADKDNKREIDELRRELSDYKEIVPYKFVLHEEFNRVVGGFENKLDKILDRLSERSERKD